MIDFDKELSLILSDDPLGLLDIKPKPTGVTADERLVASFEEVNNYIREHNHEPTASRDINERKLYSRLKGLRDSPEKAAALADYDEFGLLQGIAVQEPKEIYTVDDVVESDPLGLLGGDDPNDIFHLKNVSKAPEMPDHIAKRKACEEFEQFEPLFKKIHAELTSGIKVIKPFTSERQIEPGEVFILQGMLVFVANRGNWEKKNFGNVNARLYCVFENGTESNMLLRSLAAALWKDENSRQVIDAKQRDLEIGKEQVTEDDDATGYIYILRSLSEDPQIKEIDDLYKIGYSSQPVQQRIQNAAKEPTYLMADVLTVAEYQTYNLNPQKLELLIHTLFAEACLNFDIFDADGKRHTPREWFILPLHVIETAIDLLINGEVVNYRYDMQSQSIVPK